ncbi:hypothetical protein QQF64_015323 [Cirrhinus molitorella]|uniref:Uncharacterized protein n=1 Tax=Cirrhinus molitorella TaxID=172907 RepID=A0ABR3NUN0_9TELE
MIVVIGCRLLRARESEYVMRDFKTVVLLWEREEEGESERERERDAITAFALFIFDSVLVIEHRQTHSAQQRKSTH